MKHLLKVILICGLLILLPAGALADEMANDDFASVSCGNVHTLALRNNGDLWAWGANEEGQVGNGGKSDNISISNEGGLPCQATPVMVLENAKAIAAGGWHSLAIRDDGSLWGWGMNAMGQLGLADDADVLSPVKLMDDVAAVAAGYDFTLALKTDGSLWFCGNQDIMRLSGSDNDDADDESIDENVTANPNEPIQVMEQVQAVAAGYMHALVIKEDGSLWAWGLNENGQIGIGEVDKKHLYQEEPAQIFESGVAAIAAGYTHSLAIMEDGALWGWGDNSGQQLLESEDEIIAAPQMLLESVQLADAAIGRTFAIREDDSLWGWGKNSMKALNYNYKETDVSAIPRNIMNNVVDVSSGGYHTMAVKQDGTLWGWGDNSFGQLAQEPGEVGLPIRIKVEYPADIPEPEPEEEEVIAPEPEPEPAEPSRGNPLPFIIGCGVLGAGGLTAGLVWRHKKKLGGVSKWRE